MAQMIIGEALILIAENCYQLYHMRRTSKNVAKVMYKILTTIKVQLNIQKPILNDNGVWKLTWNYLINGSGGVGPNSYGIFIFFSKVVIFFYI